jgi:hypothetical protein
MSSPLPGSALTMLLAQQPPFIPVPAEVMTATVELPPGDPRHPASPALRASLRLHARRRDDVRTRGGTRARYPCREAFWEPGGDVIHYQAANHLGDAWSRFVVVMIGVPGEPMLALVSDRELAERRDRRAPRRA